MAPETLLERFLDPEVEPPSDRASERVLDAALELGAASGIRNLTMDAVAARAGVGRMTVYRRFGSRERLIEALSIRETRRCLAELDAAVDPEAEVPDQIGQGFVATLRIVRNHPLLERLARLEPELALAAFNADGAAVFTMARAFTAGRLERAKREGRIGDLDPVHAAEILVRLGFSFMLIRESTLPLEDDARAAELARSLIAPILGAD
jgi:AcrR family transcriptional regulator